MQLTPCLRKERSKSPAARQEEKWKIAFADKGTGMPEDVLPKLFSPLFTTEAQVMGFGLAICKRIAESHGA